jgi:hypothetical protein
MSVAFREWRFTLVDSETGKAVNDDSGLLLPMTAGSPVSPTLYSDDRGTSISSPLVNPRTFTNGSVRFWTARSVTTLDLTVLTAKGQAYFLEDVPFSRHRIVVNEKDRSHMLVMPFGASDNTETDTGFDLSAGLLVTDAHMKVTTVDSGETLDWGILSSESNGDADGFMLVQSVATAGFVTGYPVITGGANIDYAVHTSGYGAFLKQGIAGADAVATVGGVTRRYYLTDGVAKSVTYTGTAGSDTAAGYLILEYKRLFMA